MFGRPQRIRLVVAFLVLAASLPGCRRDYLPVDVWDPSDASAGAGRAAPTGSRAVAVSPIAPPSSAAAPGGNPLSTGTPGGRVTVGRGETLYAISRRTGVPVRSLIEANGLTPPFRLLAGQELALPANRFHQVQPGDTLYSVSRRYNVAMNALVRENNLQEPYTIRLGERLQLPGTLEPERPAPRTAVAERPPVPQHLPAPAAALPPPPAPPPPAQAAPPAPSPAGPIPPTPPARDLPLPTAVAPGSPPPGLAAPTPDPAPIPSAPGTLGTLPAPGVPPPPPPPPSPPPAVAAPPAAVPAPPPATARVAPSRPGSPFIWPVRGRVVAGYGPRGRGLLNDGVNNAAPAGTPVLAAGNGVVAYAGNELRGFGNLLLVKHADGYITAYAHNDRLLVRRGEQVRRGQPIAQVGSTGNVSEPQLHFEIRRGTRALDPAEFLDTVPAGRQVGSLQGAPRGVPGGDLSRGAVLAARPDPG